MEDHLNASVVPGAPKFTSINIASRLSKLVEKYAREDRFRLHALYKYGSVVIDVSRLPEGTYSPDGIAEHMMFDTTSLATVWDLRCPFSEEMVRFLIDFLDENKGHEGLFATNKPEAYRLAHTELLENVAAEKCNTITERQVQRKYESLARYVRGVSANTKGFDQARLRHFFRHGSESLDLVKVGPGVYTQDEIDAWQQRMRQSRQPRQRKKRAIESTVPSSSMMSHHKRSRTQISYIEATDDDDGSSANFNDEATPEFDSLFPQDTMGLDNSFVAVSMSSISRLINTAVHQRSRAAKINETQLFTFDISQPASYDNNTAQIIEYLLACDRSQFSAGIRKFNTMRTARMITLEEFVQCVIGCALTVWVFQPEVKLPWFETKSLQKLHEQSESIPAEYNYLSNPPTQILSLARRSNTMQYDKSSRSKSNSELLSSPSHSQSSYFDSC